MSAEFYEAQLKRVSQTFTDIVAIRTAPVETVPGDPDALNAAPTADDFQMATTAYQLILEQIESYHHQCSVAIGDYRSINDEWMKDIRKMSGADKAAEQQANTAAHATLNLDSLFRQAQAKLRDFGTIIITLKANIRKCEKIRTNCTCSTSSSSSCSSDNIRI